jgi:iron complex outermembrane receptor protein
VTNSVAQAFLPPDKNLQWANLFVQDQVAVRNDVDFIAGAKLESNVYTGIEFLPNVRVAWRPSVGNMLWASYARAVRSPSRVDRDFYAPGVSPYLLAGNDTFDSEVANDYELGYRAQPAANVSLSITGFVTDFSRLRSLEPRPGGIVFANGIEGTNTGVEAWGTWRVLPNWQLAGGVTALRERWRVVPGSVDVGGVAALGNDPAVQWNLRSSWDVTRQIGFDVTARRIGALPSPAVPAYTAVDARVFWRPSPKWEFSLSGQNLLDPIHAEWGVATNRIEVERGFYLAFQWTP